MRDVGINSLRRRRAYEVVHDELQNDILSGRLRQGQPLPTETALVERFLVTRHTVREAMRVLEQSGLVHRGLARRLHVTPPSYQHLAPRTSRALLMQKVTFRQLSEVAMHLEICAVEVLSRNITEDVLAQLQSNLWEMEKAVALGQSIIDLDIAFHSIIAEATGNCALHLAREPISLLFYPSLAKLMHNPATRHKGARRLLAAHAEIVAALSRHDTDTARLWMGKHMADFRRGWEAAGLNIDAPADTPDRNIERHLEEPAT